MGRLETAGSSEAIATLMRAGALSVETVRRALGWDYLFIACYGPLIAIAAAFAGRRIGPRWEYAGAVAAFASLLAALLDAVENTALLYALEGRSGAGLASVVAIVKFVLVLPAALFALVASVAAAIDALRARPLEPFPVTQALTSSHPERTCDVVMKGGITSGVVYPRAIARLARDYRFVNVGGASAGAIAASATAAAEYARANGRDGFAALDSLPAWLGKDGHLFRLFAPQPSTKAPFEIFAAFLGNVPAAFKATRAFAAAVWHMPAVFVVGLLPGGFMAVEAFRTSVPASGVTGAVALTAVLVPLALVFGAFQKVVCKLPQNGFGMSSGRLGRHLVLSGWLAELIDGIAGLEGTPLVRERPLIFADLWTAGRGPFSDVEELRRTAAALPRSKRVINFEALTTSLCHGRPYRLPDLPRAFYFRPADLRRALPDYVVDWMVNHAGKSEHPLPPGHYRLPEAHDLPVVFAARLSLSFPFLISAVRLWGIDWSRPANRKRKKDDERPVQLDECWMSDGGIASNFPIHFFDALVPGRPTFGLDLEPFGEDRGRSKTESDNVFLPDNNREGFQESWNHFSGVGGFTGALVDSIQAFFDNMEARAPGFRDRIARIYLAPDEGGLNLTMPPEILARLGERGVAAGDKIVKRFIEGTGWDNHRWVRLRLLLGQLDPLLRDLAEHLRESPAPTPPPSYPWTHQQRPLAEATIADLMTLGEILTRAGKVTLETDSPAPLPEMRIVPRI